MKKQAFIELKENAEWRLKNLWLSRSEEQRLKNLIKELEILIADCE